MNLKKKMLSLLICILVASSFVTPAYAAKTSWKLSNGILTISGSGAMDNYGDNNLSPWYNHREEINKVVIKSGVTSIGMAAFYNLPNLTSVEIADSVTTIGDYAFLECTKLKNVDMSSKVKYIGDAAFKQCANLQSIDLPKGLESIGYEAFFLCEGLKSITIPSSVTTLEECVFAYCHGLVTATVNANIDTLPYWTFYDCESLVSLTLSQSISSIGNKAVYDCERLTHVSSGADEKTANQIETQIKKQVSGVSDVKPNSGSENSSVYTDDNVYQEVVKNDDVIINGTVSDGNVEVDVVINDKKEWDTVNDNLDKYIAFNNTLNNQGNMNVIIQTQNDMSVSKDVINKLAGTNSNLILKGNTYQVSISCRDLTAGKNYGDISFQYSLEKIDKPGKSIKDVIGDAEAYYLQFKSSCDIPLTVKIDFGSTYIQNFASAFLKNFSSYEHTQTVRMDTLGVASFRFTNINSLTTFLIGINVDGKYTQAILPDSEYNGLTDAYGNRYEITGRESKWGLNINQVLMIMGGIMIAVFAAVGGGMFYMQKRKQAMQKIYEEVMSSGYDPDEHKRKYRIIKKKNKAK